MHAHAQALILRTNQMYQLWETQPNPASYRGCIVAKQLQKRRDEAKKVKQLGRVERKTFTSNQAHPNVTFADATLNKEQTDLNDPKIESLAEMMAKLLDKFAKQEEILQHFSFWLTKIEKVTCKNG